MKRSKGLDFLPHTIPFSEMDDWQVDVALGARDDRGDVWVEKTLLQLMSELKNDKERCVLLIEVLRNLNYQIDYTSAAKALNVEWRWYMRIKEQVKEQVERFDI